ncbi:hypothetical protein [Streptomyces sp. NPDC057426]|uniref:hypothetical protein n=1 Tax=Streptomyces sp. NPDC057426 TaxID=3346128 RepID=UPI003680733E
MDDFLIPPPGWRYAAYPWFARDTAPDLPKLVQVGRVLLPEFFHLVIGTEDAWSIDREGRPWVDAGPTVLFLDFQVFQGEVDMAHATSIYFDLPEVYERVRKAVGPSKWKRLGIHYITQYLAEFTEEEGRPDTDTSAYPSYPSTARSRRPEVALEWLDKLQSHAAEAYAEARGTPSPKRKRVKMTDEFLQEVATVYRVAENMDMPPTRDVANHFKAPHSTAAKWVAAARRKKFLPPAEAAGNEAARAAARHGAPTEPHAQRRIELEDLIHGGVEASIEEEQDPVQKQQMIDELRDWKEELERLGGELPGRDG